MENKFQGFSGKEFKNLEDITGINGGYFDSVTKKYTSDDKREEAKQLIQEVKNSLSRLAEELKPKIKETYPLIYHKIAKIDAQDTQKIKEELRLSFAESEKPRDYPQLKVEIKKEGLRVTAHLEGKPKLKTYKENLEKSYNPDIIKEIHYKLHKDKKLSDDPFEEGVYGYDPKDDFKLDLKGSEGYFDIGKFIDQKNSNIRTPGIVDEILGIFKTVYPVYDLMMGREAKLDLNVKPNDNERFAGYNSKPVAKSPDKLPTAEELEVAEEKRGEEEIKGLSNKKVEEYIKTRTDEGSPHVVPRTVKTYERDVKLSAALKKIYGKCQAGDESFKKEDGENYLETHHLIPLESGGSDHRSNMVVLCPMCHKKLHHGSRKVQLEVLYSLKGWQDTAEIVKKLIADSQK